MRESFNKYFLDKGGVYIGDDIKIKNVINFANEIIRNAKRHYPNLPDIYIDIINSMSFNASAALDEDKYYIGLNLGLLNLIQDVSYKIYSNEGFQLDVDSADNIILNNDVKIAFDISKKGLEFDYDKGFSFLTFNNEDDVKIADYQFQVVLKFVIHHEIGHILNGHVAFMKNKGITELQEEYKNDVDINVNLSQTLEMDADSFASNMAFNEINYLLNSDAKNMLLYKNWEEIVSNFTYSMYAFIRIFGFYKLRLSATIKSPHPEPPMRMAMIMSNILVILDALKVENIEELIEKCFDGVKAAEEDLAKITFFDDQLDKLEIIFVNSDYQKYSYQIMENWNKLRDELEPYAFRELPPKSTE